MSCRIEIVQWEFVIERRRPNGCTCYWRNWIHRGRGGARTGPKGEKTIVFDINDRKTLLRGVEDKITIVKGDVSNYSHVFNVVKNYQIEVIYHLGSMLSLPSDADPWSSFRVNAQGTFQVLEAARILGVKKVIFSSTLATYGIDIRESVIDD